MHALFNILLILRLVLFARFTLCESYHSTAEPSLVGAVIMIGLGFLINSDWNFDCTAIELECPAKQKFLGIIG